MYDSVRRDLRVGDGPRVLTLDQMLRCKIKRAMAALRCSSCCLRSEGLGLLQLQSLQMKKKLTATNRA